MSPLRRIFRPACCVLIGALLFAQAAFAMRPCVEPGMSTAAAASAQSNGDCCESAVMELNLCAAQCGDGNKLAGPTDSFRLHAVTAARPVLPQPPQDNGGAISNRLHLQRDLAPDPPLILRFCRFLI
jgi:hypothetical protein